jgi:hypothetical protein
MIHAKASHRLGEVLAETVNHKGGGHNKKHADNMSACSNGQIPVELGTKTGGKQARPGTRTQNH